MEDAFKLFLGRWSSQSLTTAIATGMIDAISDGANTIEAIAAKTGVNADTGYRLLRAMAAIGVLKETSNRTFSLTPTGELFTSSHPESLKNAMLWEHCTEQVNAWTLLPEAIKTGKQSLLAQSLGASDPWAVLQSNQNLRDVFNKAMTSYSKNDNGLVLGAYDWANSKIESLVDVGGGQGYLVASIVSKVASITGYVYELADTIKGVDSTDRVHYVAGDMFTGQNLPSSDAYIMKHVLHDWDDESCKKILKVIHGAAKDKAKMFIAEMVLPEPGEQSHPFGFLLDLQMMVACSGKERTLQDYNKLFEASGWKFVKMHTTPGPLQLIEAVKS